MAVLEHEILGVLYSKPTMAITAHGSEKEGYTPIYKRDYGSSILEFGVNSGHVDPPFWDVYPPAKQAIRVRA